VEADIARRRYHGAVITVARGGKPALQLALGTGDRERAKPLTPDSVFSIFSVTKAITNILVLRAIELGRFSLTTKVSEIIPEFSGGLRQHITVFHLITHTSGLPMIWTPKQGMYIDEFDTVLAAIIELVHSVEPPGERAAYSPMANHVLLGECLRRTDPQRRSYRQIVEQDLFGPLAMHDSAVGLRRDLKSRHVVPDFQGNVANEHPGHNNLGRDGAFQEEFAEMLRRGGELGGTRILSPATIELATRNWTGEKPNELYKILAHKRGWQPSPASIGLGFSLRGDTV
jgi:CubicO group peptidase (beta-lactamase class C family)